jgi:NAD(P)-dependent dehydrogenase (short-subunit alcohol dehydrogenase family)
MTSGIVAITGGAGALGSTLARSLVARGYQVALLDTDRAKDRLKTLEQEIAKENGKAIGIAGDFATEAAWTAALAAIKTAFGAAPSHAALIAGGWAGGAPLYESKSDSYANMMSANGDTVFHALRSLLPGMVAAKHGSVVVIGSRVVERPWTSTGAAAYAASKSAAVALAQTAAQEVLAHGVRINAILPSTMDTAANRTAMPSVDPSTWVSLASAAGVIAFLLSDEARDVSGAAIPVYGRA